MFVSAGQQASISPWEHRVFRRTPKIVPHAYPIRNEFCVLFQYMTLKQCANLKRIRGARGNTKSTIKIDTHAQILPFPAIARQRKRETWLELEKPKVKEWHNFRTPTWAKLRRNIETEFSVLRYCTKRNCHTSPLQLICECHVFNNGTESF